MHSFSSFSFSFSKHRWKCLSQSLGAVLWVTQLLIVCHNVPPSGARLAAAEGCLSWPPRAGRACSMRAEGWWAGARGHWRPRAFGLCPTKVGTWGSFGGVSCRGRSPPPLNCSWRGKRLSPGFHGSPVGGCGVNTDLGTRPREGAQCLSTTWWGLGGAEMGALKS